MTSVKKICLMLMVSMTLLSSGCAMTESRRATGFTPREANIGYSIKPAVFTLKSKTTGSKSTFFGFTITKKF